MTVVGRVSVVVLDSSCLIAAACDWHVHHEVTVEDLERRRRAGERFVVAAPAVLEAYSVLTRLPPTFRLAPADAAHVLDASWSRTDCVALTASEYWMLLRGESSRGVGGGRIYDAVIAQCARKAKADEILTWNVDHFAPLAAEGLTVSRPRTGG
jgi:predicted nucleic acid-binding protein